MLISEIMNQDKPFPLATDWESTPGLRQENNAWWRFPANAKGEAARQGVLRHARENLIWWRTPVEDRRALQNGTMVSSQLSELFVKIAYIGKNVRDENKTVRRWQRPELTIAWIEALFYMKGASDAEQQRLNDVVDEAKRSYDCSSPKKTSVFIQTQLADIIEKKGGLA